MATSLESVKNFISSQLQDDEKWAHNMKVLRAGGLFLGAVVLFRSFGDLMAI